MTRSLLKSYKSPASILSGIIRCSPRHYFTLFVLLAVVHSSALSQSQYLVDSLERELKSHQASKLEMGKNAGVLYDTTEADIVFALSKAYWGNSPDKAMSYAKQTLALSERMGYKKGIANGNHSIGVIHFQRGEYIAALDYYEQALQYRLEANDQKGIANAYNNIGEVFRLQGNFPEALRNHLLALKTRESNADRAGVGRSYNNIGLVYMDMGNDAEALENWQASLEIAKETGDQQHLAALYNNIGILRSNEGNLTEALKSYEASLAMAKEAGNKQSMISNYINIGNIFHRQGRYGEALDRYFSSLSIAEEIQDKGSIANCYYNIGLIYVKQKNLEGATQSFNKSLSLAEQVGSLEALKNSHEGLASLDSAKGNFDKSLAHYKLFILYRDSLFNEEISKKTVQQKMQFDFDKQKALISVEQERKDSVAREELAKHKLIRNGFVGGFGVMLLFALVFFRQRNRISKEKRKSEDEKLKSDYEKKRSDALLLNILPDEVAEELKLTGTAKAKSFTMVTVMFTDFKDFTRISEKVSAELMVDEIHTCFSAFDAIMEKYNIEKIKTIGDAYLCASGLPVPSYTHANDMIMAAFEIRNYMVQRKREKEAKGEIAFEIRIGVHTGPLVAGIVGKKKYAYDIWGDTVNLAARMEQNSDVGKINISGSTYDLVKEQFDCIYRGKIQAKNKGEIDMYFVEKK